MRDFQQQVLDFIQKRQLIEKGDHVCVACSGGVDSMVLLRVLKSNEPELGIRVSAVHVDHMLRGEESAADRRFTERMCWEWEIPLFSTAIPVDRLLAENGGNRQDVCRRERYRYFEEVMKASGAHKLATAHHADDQLETLLMTGLRGTLHTGTFGIPAMRPFASGRLIRPLLAVSRESIENYADSSVILFRQDPSNFSDAYTRNRIRKNVIPLLKEENSEAAVRAAQIAAELQEDQVFLDREADRQLKQLARTEDDKIFISARAFRAVPSALQKRMLPLLLRYLYPKGYARPTVQLAEQMREAMRSSSGTVFLHLPQNRLMTRRYDEVEFGPDNPETEEMELSMPLGSDWSPPVEGFSCRTMGLEEAAAEDDAEKWYFSPEGRLPLFIRNRKNGDRIRLPGMEHPKKVARLMIDEKIPVTRRDTWPLITTGQGEILLVPGIRPSVSLRRHSQEGDWVLFVKPVSGDLKS